MIDWTINTIVTRKTFFVGTKKWLDTIKFSPPKFEHKLCRHKQRYGKLPPTLYHAGAANENIV